MRARGFTLIELVITVAIVGLLATAALPLAEIGFRRAKEQDLRSALYAIRTALDEYKDAADAGRIEMELGDSGFPPTLDELVNGVVDAKSPDAKKMYFLRRLPRDPFYPDTSVPASETWGLRAYASEPEDPQPGEDVFDVYSTSTGVALNGTSYSTW
ncbi:MAG: type II secretion system GspH family protein [Gammaproteobacteria bacterium]|jgi:general secretion pathway protein G|nr:type II secretion system GspH family protein [Gammaproteobacteria bacterium]